MEQKPCVILGQKFGTLYPQILKIRHPSQFLNKESKDGFQKTALADYVATTLLASGVYNKFELISD